MAAELEKKLPIPGSVRLSFDSLLDEFKNRPNQNEIRLCMDILYFLYWFFHVLFQEDNQEGLRGDHIVHIGWINKRKEIYHRLSLQLHSLIIRQNFCKYCIRTFAQSFSSNGTNSQTSNFHSIFCRYTFWIFASNATNIFYKKACTILSLPCTFQTSFWYYAVMFPEL